MTVYCSFLIIYVLLSEIYRLRWQPQKRETIHSTIFFFFADSLHIGSKFIQIHTITFSLTLLGNPIYFTLPHLGILRPGCILISAIG